VRRVARPPRSVNGWSTWFRRAVLIVSLTLPSFRRLVDAS
jgi:hypothetical protein